MVATRVLDAFVPDLVGEVRVLADAVERETGVEPFGAETWSGLIGGTVRGDRGAMATDARGRVVGYAHAAHHHEHDWSVEVAALRTHRDVEPALVAEAIDAIAVAGGGHVTLWIHGAAGSDDTLAGRVGFEHERDLLQMRVPLPLAETPAWPSGVLVRAFRPGEDDDDWLEVNNRAFAGHPEQGDWTLDHLHRHEAEPWFDADGFLVAFDDEGMAGFCWTKVHPADPPREPTAVGEIYVIGADPRWQGRGLGRALTAGGLESLAQRAVTVGMLYVDGANTAAVGLYRALGFTEHRVDRAYGRDVRAARERDAMSGEVSRYGASRAELAAALASWGEPRYRIDQVWSALHAPLPLEDATALPRALRTRVADAFPASLAAATESTSTDAMTTKWLWTCTSDGTQVETVLMRSPNRATVCVSSQAGCAMGCTFSATGQAGFERHLAVGEIVEQVARAGQATTQRVSNVVFMGMGEPLANYDATWGAVERLHDDFGISARRITVSTVGVVPGIRRLAAESLPVTLAVSLHAPDDALRNQLVPLNRRYPIAEVLDAAADFAGAHGRRVTFEYACIAGVNDRLDQAEALGTLLRAFPGPGGVHVNLIPLNPTAGFPGHAARHDRLRVFAERLEGRGVTATIRRNRGTDIDAACGQLRARVGTDPTT